jgi:uncharacterized protein
MPRCPVCKTQTELIKYENVPIHSCGSCGGHWLSELKLGAIVERRDVAMPDAVKRKMVELADASNSTGELWCLGCGTAMAKEFFRGWPRIQLDRCPKCQGLWLDRGELEKCQIFWEYVRDHPEGEKSEAALRVAALEAEWAHRRQEQHATLARLQELPRMRHGTAAALAAMFGLAGA